MVSFVYMHDLFVLEGIREGYSHGLVRVGQANKGKTWGWHAGMWVLPGMSVSQSTITWTSDEWDFDTLC